MKYCTETIKAVHIELTSKCNAGCPQCLRYTDGTVKASILPLHTMTLDELKQLMSESFIKQLHTMTFCGNYGDSLMAPNLVEVLTYVKSLNPAMYIEIHTNGGYARSTTDWLAIVRLASLVIFAIDGLEDTNGIYRRNVNWNTLMDNVRFFIHVGGNAEWHYLVFKHNEHQVEDAAKLASVLGFSNFRPKFTDRFLNMRTGAVSSQFNIITNVKGKKEIIGTLEPPDNAAYRNKVTDKMVSVKDYDNYLAEATVVCQAAELSSIYIASTGHVFPCCWIGYHTAYTPGKDSAYDELMALMNKYGGADKFDALNTSLETVVNSEFFQDVSKNGAPTKGSDMLKVCAGACNTDNVCDAITDWVPAWKRP